MQCIDFIVKLKIFIVRYATNNINRMGLPTSSPNLLINVFKMFALNGNFSKIYNLNRQARVSLPLVARQTKVIVHTYIHICDNGCIRFSLWVGEYVCMYVLEAEQLPS